MANRNKQKGSAAERTVADYLAAAFDDDRIDRRVLRGQKDRGDIQGVQCVAGRVVVEVKNHARMDLAGWMGELETEKGNDDAPVGVVVVKRRGRGDPADWYAVMPVRDWVLALGGKA